MLHEIKINVKQDPEKLYQTIKLQFLENGMEFDGNEHSGKFSGSGVKGDYTIDDKILTIRILQKPMFLPIGVLESKIKDYFNNV